MDNVIIEESKLAGHYDSVSNIQFQLGCMLIERMRIREGGAVLDVGCGTGRLALYLSKIVKSSGSVVGIDPSIHRIDIANNKLKNRMLQNVCFTVGSAETLKNFPESAFDDVYYSSVFHWINDKKAVLKETYRVLNKGGKIGITTINRDNLHSFRAVMIEVLGKPPYARYVKKGEGRSYPVTMKELETLLAEVGFCEITVDCLIKKRHYDSPQKLIDFYEASSFGNFMRSVPEDLQANARCDIKKELEKRRTPSGIELTSNIIFATAKKM
jgi:ubiquinone/menaquinone biosynthesis C-methylase UbiE